MLFNTTIFGPIRSRRLGNSLGINLLPNNGKICSFDCIYCECGLNKDGRDDTKLSTREEVKKEGIQKGLCDYFKMSTNSFIFLTSKVEPNFPPMNNLNLMTHF